MQKQRVAGSEPGIPAQYLLSMCRMFRRPVVKGRRVSSKVRISKVAQRTWDIVLHSSMLLTEPTPVQDLNQIPIKNVKIAT